MGKWFDDVSKSLANGMTRRDAFRLFGAAGVAAMFGVKSVSAGPQGDCAKNPPTGACAGQTDCSPEGNFCTCLPRTEAEAALCHQPQSCIGLVACDSDSDCTAAGLSGQWRCAFTCCGPQAVCVPRCGSHVTITATELGQGLTTAG